MNANDMQASEEARIDITPSLKKAVKRLIAEEQLAWQLYSGLVYGSDEKTYAKIGQLFMSVAKDELFDHHEKLVEFACKAGIPVPVTQDEYLKLSSPALSKLFTKSLKRGVKLDRCLEIAIEAEKLALASYNEALDDESITPIFKNLIVPIFYDEQEHLNDFATLKNVADFEDAVSGFYMQ